METESDLASEVPRREVASIEVEPEFALFLDYLSRASLAYPEELVNAADLMLGDEQLFASVELDPGH